MYTYHKVYKVIFRIRMNYELAIVLLYDMLSIVQAPTYCYDVIIQELTNNGSYLTLFLGKILLYIMNNYLYCNIMLF